MPVLETLLVGSGSGSSKLTGVSFSGISFQHATWCETHQVLVSFEMLSCMPRADLTPGNNIGDGAADSEEGFVENQSGDAACGGFFGPVVHTLVSPQLPSSGGPLNRLSSSSAQAAYDQRMVANVVMMNTKRVRFDRCEFAHLGANAIDFAHGAHDNVISDCLFRDISGAAVQIGRTDGLTQRLTDPAAQERSNTVENSIIVQPAVEYHGSVVCICLLLVIRLRNHTHGRAACTRAFLLDIRSAQLYLTMKSPTAHVRGSDGRSTPC